MRARHTGVVVARGVGAGLILLAISTAAGNSEFFFPAATSGWVSYSPLSTTTVTSASYQISHFGSAFLWIPSLLQLVMGSALILFSKPVGRWLAAGLRDDDIQPDEHRDQTEV
jgi:hypothetical protein